MTLRKVKSHNAKKPQVRAGHRTESVQYELLEYSPRSPEYRALMEWSTKESKGPTSDPGKA